MHHWHSWRGEPAAIFFGLLILAAIASFVPRWRRGVVNWREPLPLFLAMVAGATVGGAAAVLGADVPVQLLLTVLAAWLLALRGNKRAP